MTTIIKPTDFIIRAVNNYPSLYAAPSYDDSKFKILDHAFNTIGNGLYMSSFIGNPSTQQEISNAQKWFRCERAAYGYEKCTTIECGEYSYPRPSGDPSVVVPLYEMPDHPQISRWVEFDCGAKESPYPNFKKEYSMVWDARDINFSDLGIEWVDAAIWYYTKCKEFFLDVEQSKQYYTAFPCSNERRTKNTVKDYKEVLSKYKDADAITAAYEVEFIGDPHSDADVYSFIERRWLKEKQRILDFIEETLLRLGAMHG